MKSNKRNWTKKKIARMVLHPSRNPPFQINHPQSHLYSFSMSLFPFIAGNMFEINNEIVTQSMQTNKPSDQFILEFIIDPRLLKLNYMYTRVSSYSPLPIPFNSSHWACIFTGCICVWPSFHASIQIISSSLVWMSARARARVFVLPNQNVNKIIPGDRQQFEHDYDVALAH